MARKPPPPPPSVEPAPAKKPGPGGRRVGAGRKKGARNKRTVQLIAKASALGQLPHEFLASVARGEAFQCSVITDDDGNPMGEPVTCFPTLDQRIDAARAAAPFFAARLASIEHSGGIGVKKDASDLSDEELAAIAAGAAADEGGSGD